MRNAPRRMLAAAVAVLVVGAIAAWLVHGGAGAPDRSTGSASLRSSQTGSQPAGKVVQLSVPGPISARTQKTLVWLPPQYFTRAYARYRFPVVEFLPGQPNSVRTNLRSFQLASRSLAEVRRTGKPFVLVMPPLMIRPPVDTECTDIPHGPQAMTWLTDDVPRAVLARFRVAPQGRHWSMVGWSTGAFCAAKVMFTRPRQWSAAVGMGGYYQPITWGSWPHLFGGSARVRQLNSPQWLYLHRGGAHGDRLHMIASTGDPEVLRSDRRMMEVARGDPLVTASTFHGGRHGQSSYWRLVPGVLRWLAAHGAMG